MTLTHRIASDTDIPAIRALMARSIDSLQRDFLNQDQIAASRSIMGLDTQLIADQSYFVVELDGRLVGCGGWSQRSTLFGGDHSTDQRNPSLLNPARDAARVRAMFTDPDRKRMGIGRLILALSEAAARDHGFEKVELMATLAGEPLYQACGYTKIERVEVAASGDILIPLIRMRKSLIA
ncbi:MAG: GNAT family N-acetyltransferase [Sphingomonas sp.]|nr:GNAT family N-acetyltransferase [Sphingomonas sp.]